MPRLVLTSPFPSLDGLKKLYRKVKSVDAQLDDKGDLSTIRSVWSEVVENVDRGASSI